jgi:hypothetical protein
VFLLEDGPSEVVVEHVGSEGSLQIVAVCVFQLNLLLLLLLAVSILAFALLGVFARNFIVVGGGGLFIGSF